MELGLRGKRAIVTGASKGIGRACALALAAEGARVCAVARTESLLAETVRAIETAGGKGMYVAADLRRLDACRRVVEECAATFGGVDILINNAGSAESVDVLETTAEILNDALGLKTYGYLRLSQLVIPHMQKNGWGRIINIAGSAGTSPSRGNLSQSFSNVCVLNMTRGFSDAVARDGIMVNVICPGATNTDRQKNRLRERAEREGRSAEEILKEEQGPRTAAGRIAEPEDIGRVACFLASEACSYVYGNALYLDGGARRGIP